VHALQFWTLGIAAKTADFLQIEDSNNAEMFSVDKNGHVAITSTATSGNVLEIIADSASTGSIFMLKDDLPTTYVDVANDGSSTFSSLATFSNGIAMPTGQGVTINSVKVSVREDCFPLAISPSSSLK
jgi:hypothetical protein